MLPIIYFPLWSNSMSANKPPRKPKKSRRPARPTPKPLPVKARSPLGPIAPEDIQLVRTKGTPGRGGDPGGEAWKIEAAGQRAGIVFINLIDELPIGPHASIQIFLNQRHQGRQVGRVAYRAACEASENDVIYAHMRKSNIASRRAAEAAGFKDVTPSNHAQLIMQHKRSC